MVWLSKNDNGDYEFRRLSYPSNEQMDDPDCIAEYVYDLVDIVNELGDELAELKNGDNV